MKILVRILLSVLIIFSTKNCAAQKIDSGQVSKITKGIEITTPVVDFKLSGGIYLFDYLPLYKKGENNFSIYAFILKTDASTKDEKFGLHVETRIRDTRLRPFYNSNIWFQEAYVFAHTKAGDLHVGKFYKKVGFLWDGSFFGNVQYFNGLKLNPEFGAEWLGTAFSGDKVKLDYSIQYLSNNDHVDGSLAGRDVESDTNATFKNGFTARIAPVFTLNKNTKLTLGVSALYGTINRVLGQNFATKQLAADINLHAGKAGILLEVLSMKGERNDLAHPYSRPGYDDAVYYFGNVSYLFCKKMLVRFSYSQVNYRGSNSVEKEILPGVVYNIRDNIAVIAEYNYWSRTPAGNPEMLIDKSLNFVFHYAF
ncbi:MAG: hypothetical protein ACMG51_05295 [Ginsengibacter sp.]